GVSTVSGLPARGDDVVPGESETDPRQRSRRRSARRRSRGLVEQPVVARTQEARARGPVDDGARNVRADLRIGGEGARRAAKQDAWVLLRGVPEEEGAPRWQARGPCDRHFGSVAPPLREPARRDGQGGAHAGEEYGSKGQELGQLATRDVLVALPRDGE